MAWAGSRLEGGVFINRNGLISGTTVLISAATVSAGGPLLKRTALTIDFLLWVKTGGVTSMQLQDTNGDVILDLVDANILLEHPAIGGGNERGIQIVCVGSGSSVTLRCIPEKDPDIRVIG